MVDPPRSLLRQCTARTRSRPAAARTPTAGASAGTTGAGRTRALPHRHRRCRPTTPGRPDWLAVSRPLRGPRPPQVAGLAHRGGRQRAVRRRAAGCSPTTASSRASAHGAARAAPGRAHARRAGPAWPATPTARCCSAWCSTASTRGDDASRRACAHASIDPLGRPGKYNLVLTDGDAAGGHAAGATRCYLRRDQPDRRRGDRRLRALRRRPGLGARSPTTRSCVADGAGVAVDPDRRTACDPTPSGGPRHDRTQPTPPTGARPRRRAHGPDRPRGRAARRRAPRAHRARPRSCRRSGSTTTAAASCSTPSPASPEYYPTERERTILRAEAAAIVDGLAAPTRWSSSARARRTRPACCSTPSPAPASSAGSCPFEISETTLRAAADAIADEYPGVDGARRGRRLRAPPRRAPARRAAAWSPSSAGPSATSPRPSASGSWPTWPTACARATASCSAPIWSRTSAGSRPPTTTRQGVTAEFNLQRAGASSTASSTPTSTSTSSATWPASTRTRSGSRCGCGRCADQTVRDRRAGPRGVDFAAGEEMRTEISAKFRRAGVEAELADAGLRLERWMTDPDRRLRPQPLRPRVAAYPRTPRKLGICVLGFRSFPCPVSERWSDGLDLEGVADGYRAGRSTVA